MYAQVEKTKENKSRAVANSVAQKKSSVKQGFGFVDNRPEAVVQKKMQNIVNKRSQAKQPNGLNGLSQKQLQFPIQFTREWATGKVDTALDEASKKSGDSDIDTGHHKASKSGVMEKVFQAMTSTQWSQTIKALDLESGSGVNALKSLGSNLALGPTSGKRYGEPGRGFDPNITKSGRNTPRSQQYEMLIEFMNKRDSPGKKFTEQEFGYVLGILEMAEKIHFQKTQGELIDDDISMWEKGEFPDGKTWTRKAAPDYKVDLEEFTEKSVRDLKAPEHKAAVPKKEFVMKMFPKVSISKVTPNTTPLDQDALDRWKEDGFTRFYRQSDNSWYFLDQDETKKIFLKDPDFVLDHFPDTPELEKDLYGFELLRP